MKIKINDKDSVGFDLPKLIESRLLIQANSGGGKSWAIRRLIEQAFGHVQIIVIDPEGEFGNMRGKFDFVYAGKGGDAPVESRSAALLARRLLELKTSAVVDLYELPPQERKHFVRLFCEAMVNAPKELWHDVLVIIDEAHVFAPEKGESEAMGPVIDLATRGRKRGYCVVLATQRLPKLNKDAAAECNNKLIGRASQDIDRKRAAEELGFTTKEAVLSLRDLDPGEFYVFGPAISREVIRVIIGDVTVKPPKRGSAKSGVPAPSAAVKKILAKLADLPAEAQKEAQTSAELKAEIARLKRGDVDWSKIPKHILKEEYQRGYDEAQMDAVKRFKDTLYQKLLKSHGNVFRALEALSQDIDTLKRDPTDDMVPLPMVTTPKTVKYASGAGFKTMSTAEAKRITEARPMNLSDIPFEGISGPEQRILDAMAWLESIGVSEPEQTAVAFLAGYTVGGGGFNNPKGSLRTKSLIEYRGKSLVLTDFGRAFAHAPQEALTQEALHSKVLSILPTPEQRLLKPLLDAYPGEMSNEELAQASGYTAGSGGFNNPKGRLRTLGLISYPSSGKVKAREILFV